MNPVAKLHHALGEIAYAMVWSDAKIKTEEVGRFIDTITIELNPNTHEFDLLGTIFDAITCEKKDAETTYLQAITRIRQNADYLHPAMKQNFIKALERVESTYAPFTLVDEESNLLDRFRKDVAAIKGSMVYMGAIFLN